MPTVRSVLDGIPENTEKMKCLSWATASVRSVIARTMKASFSGASTVLVAAAVGAFSTAAQSTPLSLDFGDLGPFFENVGAIDTGVNVIRAGNRTPVIGTDGAITFSVPAGLKVDGITLEFLSLERELGGLLQVGVLAPNDGDVFGVLAAPLNSELDFQNLAILDPSGVTVSFDVSTNPLGSGTVYHTFALRIYASQITSAVPEPESAALLLAGLIGLLVTSRKSQRA